MAQFRVTGPDGNQYMITAPDDASDDDVMKYVESNAPSATSAINAPKPNKTSAIEAAGRGLGQGVSFGLSDELEAGLRTVGNKIADPMRPVSEIYDDRLSYVRGQNDASADEHPIAYYGGEIAGGVATPGGLARIGVRSAVRGAETLAARTAAGAVEGAAYGAANGFGRSEGGVQERVDGTVGGAALGGAVGGAVPAVIDAVKGVARPVINTVNSVVRPNEEAARRVREAIDGDIEARSSARNTNGRTVQEIERGRAVSRIIDEGRQGGELRVMDTGGENTRALARSAANNSPEAREVLQGVINNRFEGQSGRTVDFLRSLIPSPGNAPLTRDRIEEAARTARAPFYQEAYKQGANGIATDGLKTLTQAPAMQTAMKAAITNIRNKSQSSAPQLEGPNGPTLAYWDQVSRELRDLADTAARGGSREAAGDIGNLRRTLLDELDTAVPAFRDARGTARQFFQANDALEAGENFVTGKFGTHEARKAIEKMSKPEQLAFREGFVSKYIQRLEETGDRRSILGRIAESPAARERIEVALGPNRARELEAFLYVEQLQDLPRAALGNSTTARQLVELGLAGGTGILATGGNITDPQAWLVAGLTYGAARGRSNINQDMARRVAEMLVSRDEAVFRQGVQQIAYSPAMSALRSLTADLGRGARSPVIGAVSGLTMSQEETADE